MKLKNINYTLGYINSKNLIRPLEHELKCGHATEVLNSHIRIQLFEMLDIPISFELKKQLWEHI